MATVNVISNGGKGGAKGLSGVLGYVKKEEKTMWNGYQLVRGINCIPSSAYYDMMATKNRYGKTGGRMFYHIDQSFSPDENITPELAHKIAVEFAKEQFKGYEVLVGTHVDAHHIHSHFVVNSVSFENGKKYHSDKNNIQRLRDASDELCRKYGLSVIDQPQKGLEKMGTREYRAAEKKQSWKINLMAQINIGMQKAKSKDEFISFMEDLGYKVTWTDSRKYITYTTPDGNRVRDNKLHLSKYSKEMMTYEFNIRRQIIERLRSGAAGSCESIEADTVCDDLGRELESDNRDVAIGTRSTEQVARDPRKVSDIGADGESDLADREHTSGSRTVLGEGTEDEIRTNAERTGREIQRDDNGIIITGWEAERAICFGSGQSKAGAEEGIGGSLGQNAPVFDHSMPTYDVALRAGSLVADLANVIDTRPDPVDDRTQIPQGMDRKEYRKLAEKNEAHGIRMG